MSLSQDVIRRMANISEYIPMEERLDVIRDFQDQLKFSGYSRSQTRTILTAGLKGYESRRTRAEEGGIPLHRGKHQTQQGRAVRKLLEKANWYKIRKTNQEQEVSYPAGEGDPTMRRRPGKTQARADPDPAQQPSTVMFVPRTAGGTLLTMLKKVEEDLAKVTKKRIRLLEETGMKIRDMLCTSDPWEGTPCLRPKCTTCQVEWGKAGACRARSLVYENICIPCREMKKVTRYIGETCRSLYERGKEHTSDATTLAKKSHWRDHAKEQHQDYKGPISSMFTIQPLKNCRSALARQLREAIEIGRNPPGALLLNSKEEFSRCLIPGIVIGGTWREQGPDPEKDAGPDYSDLELDLDRKGVRRQEEGQDRDNKRQKVSSHAHTSGTPPHRPVDTPVDRPAESQPHLPHPSHPSHLSYAHRRPQKGRRRLCMMKTQHQLPEHDEDRQGPHVPRVDGHQLLVEDEDTAAKHDEDHQGPHVPRADDHQLQVEDEHTAVEDEDTCEHNIQLVPGEQSLQEDLEEIHESEHDLRDQQGDLPFQQLIPEHGDDIDNDDHRPGGQKKTFKEKLSMFRRLTDDDNDDDEFKLQHSDAPQDRSRTYKEKLSVFRYVDDDEDDVTKSRSRSDDQVVRSRGDDDTHITSQDDIKSSQVKINTDLSTHIISQDDIKPSQVKINTDVSTSQVSGSLDDVSTSRLANEDTRPVLKSASLSQLRSTPVLGNNLTNPYSTNLGVLPSKAKLKPHKRRLTGQKKSAKQSRGNKLISDFFSKTDKGVSTELKDGERKNGVERESGHLNGGQLS